jgi:two-component system chemotaxis response regulator CheB
LAGKIPIVTVGASAGAVEAFTRLAAGLPADFPGAVFLVMHFPVYATSVMPKILERVSALPVSHAVHEETIEPGRIYVAPPDRHLIVLGRTLELVRGPRENGHRPAIDPLFRSAAIAHGRRVIGVVLTGNLDDGTAGLSSIKHHGGVAVVQDPADANFASMPASAIEHVAVDVVTSLADLPGHLVAIAAKIAALPEEPGEYTMDDDDVRETLYAKLDLPTIENVAEHPGKPSPFGCPDCGGVLWETEEGTLLRYRCRVGHAWSGEALLGSQAEQLDQALWTALRALEENASLTLSLAKRARKRGNEILAARYERDAETAHRRAQVIRDALLSGLASPKRQAEAAETQAAG